MSGVRLLAGESCGERPHCSMCALKISTIASGKVPIMWASSSSTKISAPSLWSTLALLVPITLVACGGSNNNHPPDAPSPDASIDAPPDAPPDALAPLTILAAGASEGAITDEAALFTTTTGLSYTFTIQSATALQTTITSGAMQPDVVVVTPAVITAINDFVLAGSNVNLGQIVSGLAVRSTDTAPVINTAAAFKDTLNQADIWYYSTGTAGKTFEKIVAAVGLSNDDLTQKQKVLAGGKDAMLALAADTTHAHPIAVSQLSEIRSVPTVQYVGPYPSDLPSDLLTPTVYAAVIFKNSTRVADAQKLLQFFLSAEFQARLAQSGFSPYTAP